MYETIWFLAILSLFGGTIVPVLMGACVWIERREHRIRMAGLSSGDWECRRHRAATNRSRVARFAPHRLQRSDLVKVWPIVAFAFVLLMPLAAWTDPVRDDFLSVIHPIVCVGWWLNMRSRGIIHAEVYALSTWVMAYVAWSLSMLAPFEHWNQGYGGLAGDFPSFLAERLGTTSEVAIALWLLYVVSGIACVLAGVLLARSVRPIVSPLLAVAIWIPFVSGVLITNLGFTVLGIVIAVGVAGFGISREVRRSQDDADTRAWKEVRESRSTSHWKASIGLIMRTAAAIGVAVAIPISVRESGMAIPAAEFAATWSVLVLAPLASALLARLDKRPHVASEWAAWGFLATAGTLAAYHLIGPSYSFISERFQGEPWTYNFIFHPQAFAVWLVAVVSFVVAYRTGKLRSYGALLLGLLWFPIATFAASLGWSEHELDPVPDPPVGFASVVTMGCVLLVIMWRVFGPGETAVIDMKTNWVTPTPDCNGPEAKSKSAATAPESAT